MMLAKGGAVLGKPRKLPEGHFDKIRKVTWDRSLRPLLAELQKEYRRHFPLPPVSVPVSYLVTKGM